MGDDSEWMKLPAEEKVQHKVWKARVAGYEEVIKLFRKINDEKSPEYSRYAGLIKKFVTDSNAVAQEKALEAVVLFVENAAVAARTAGEVVSGVITKCLNATKQKTKEQGKEIIMLYIEAEKQDVVAENLMEGLSNKNPKVVIGCIQTLREALRDFGNKIMQIKPMLKFLPKLMEDRDKNVREESKQLVVEMYRWVGAAIKPKLTDFKPLQVAELEAEFEKLGGEKPQQARFLKSQQDLKAKMEEKAAMADAGVEPEEEEDTAEDVDPYDLIEPVNILAALPKDFFDKVEAVKWQERKEALEALQKLCENPKIENGDFAALVRVLLKVIGKDKNVMLVAIGGKCLAGLAVGLRKKFSSYASACFPVIIEKFKEKKPAVVAALRDAADAVYMSISLEPIMEDLVAALENKNPQIKAETASFLGRCFARLTLSTLPKKQLKGFCTSLLKTVNDTALEVREASFVALGTAMKVVTEKNIMAFMADVDAIKMQKIKECCDNAVLLNAKGEPRTGGAKPAAAAAAPKAGSSTAKPVTRPGAPPPMSVRPKTAPAKAGGPPRAKEGGPPKGKKKAAASKSSVPAEERTEKILSDEAIEEKAEEFLGADVLVQLVNANWKERLAGMERFMSRVKPLDKIDIPCQVCVRTVCKKPGLKDNNFQVLKLRLDLMVLLAQNADFTRTTAEFCLTDLVDKIGDVKNGAGVQEALSCIAESTSLEFVSSEVMKLAFAQKNPKNQSESLNWMSKAVTEFGFKIQVKQHISNIKKAFAATNPAVRTAAIGLVTVLYMYMGPQLRMFFEDEKPALLQQIDAEFEKLKGQKAPAPVRGAKPTGGGDDNDDEEEDGDGENKEDNVADLVPRNDVGDRFSPELITAMSDKGWKVRGEALQKIISILNEAKFITGNLGPLPEAIKGRLGDANKNLVTTTVGICVTLATNMGPHCKQHIKVIGPAIINCFGDSKPALRSAAVGALNAWVDQTSLTPLVECEAFSDALKLENPNLRQELFGWLTERLPNHKPLPKDEMRLCLPHVLGCLEDRNAEVRKKAQESLVPFMIHVGYDSMFKAASKLKPASKDQVVPILEKARENLPAKPVKAKKAPAKSASKAAVSASYNDYDEPDPPPAKKEKSPTDGAGDSKAGPKGPGKTKGKALSAPSKRKKVEEDLGPPITVVETKEKRFKDEKNMKTMKWNFTDPRLEYVTQLTLQMEKNFSKTMMDQLFHNDFKQHIKAIETLIKCLDTLQNEQVANLDLILRWMTLRFFDTNPSMLNKALEYLQAMFKVLYEIDYNLHEIEAISFLPYLVIKVGENKDNVRRDVRAIFKLVYNVYPASKMFVFISDGLKSKNSKTRTECLEELGYLIETHGITICQPTPAVALKAIASQISDRDNGVRNAALNSTVVAYLILGEGIYKYIGTLRDKDQDYLDERIKRSNKNRAAAAKQEPRPKTAPAPAQRSASQATIQRPNTALPKSHSNPTSVRKEFQLEPEEDNKGDNYPMPQLIQYSDLDDIFQPVKMPTIKARPPSPNPKFFSSTDTTNTVNIVISQVTNQDISTCVQALAQIDEVLKDRDRVLVLEDHVEQLLVAMSMQFKIVYNSHMGDEDTPKEEVIRLYRCLLSTLLSLFQNATLAILASKEILKELEQNLITMLLDVRLMELDDGPQIVRSVNVLVVKIIEKADQTNVLCASIRLLQECAGSETCSNKFIELTMKCLWKMTRRLPDTIKELNLDRVLYEIHLFLREFPTPTWKHRSSNQPLRTVRTILHSLAKLKGSKILGHLEQIDAGEVSEVKTFLQNVLHSEGTKINETERNGVDDNRSKSASKSKRFSKNTHDMLTEIFKKIGSKENTKEGLQDLYDFKKKFPDADLEPFLKKSSQFFQNYIERGLKAIENEQNEKSESSGPEVRSSQPLSDRSISSDYIIDKTSKIARPTTGQETQKSEDPSVEPRYYLERLKKLRAECGLDSNVKVDPGRENKADLEPPPAEPKVDSFVPEYSPQDEDNSITDSQADKRAAAPDVSSLKARLQRIKQMANS